MEVNAAISWSYRKSFDDGGRSMPLRLDDDS